MFKNYWGWDLGRGLAPPRKKKLQIIMMLWIVAQQTYIARQMLMNFDVA